jgi:hypothetical protein
VVAGSGERVRQSYWEEVDTWLASELSPVDAMWVHNSGIMNVYDVNPSRSKSSPCEVSDLWRQNG